MKIFLIIPTILISFLSFSQTPKDLFKKAANAVLLKRKAKLIKSISKRLVIPEDTVENALSFREADGKISINGYLKGELGICKLNATLSLKQTQSLGTCIDSFYKVTTFFP